MQFSAEKTFAITKGWVCPWRVGQLCPQENIHSKKYTMQAVKDGDTVKIHYKGTLTDGTVFDNSEGRDPLQIEVGANQVIPGFENAVRGMKVGDTKTETIPAADAYGDPKKELVIQAPVSQMPEGHDPKVGDQLQMTTPQGQQIPVRITEVAEENVTLDANHPLAGQDLTFELKLVEIA